MHVYRFSSMRDADALKGHTEAPGDKLCRGRGSVPVVVTRLTSTQWEPNSQGEKTPNRG